MPPTDIEGYIPQENEENGIPPEMMQETEVKEYHGKHQGNSCNHTCVGCKITERISQRGSDDNIRRISTHGS